VKFTTFQSGDVSRKTTFFLHPFGQQNLCAIYLVYATFITLDMSLNIRIFRGKVD